jgi:hypothetical protein
MTHAPAARLALLALLTLTACRLHPSTGLGRAAFDGDVTAVRSLVSTVPVDTLDGPFTPLMLAARAGRLATMQVLIDAGADLNHADERYGWTPLMHALHKGRRDAARLLLARGADAARGTATNSPLEMATLDNDVELMRVLLQGHPSRPQMVRAFDLAVSGGAMADVDRPLLGGCHTDAARLLYGADRTLAARGGAAAWSLWWATQKGCQDVVALVAGNSEPSIGR